MFFYSHTVFELKPLLKFKHEHNTTKTPKVVIGKRKQRMYERKTRPEIKQTPVTSAYIMYRIIHMYCAYKLRNKYRV